MHSKLVNKKIERNCLAWISIISLKNEIVVAPSVLLIFNFLAFIEETQHQVASSFIYFFRVSYHKNSRLSLLDTYSETEINCD